MMLQKNLRGVGGFRVILRWIDAAHAYTFNSALAQIGYRNWVGTWHGVEPARHCCSGELKRRAKISLLLSLMSDNVLPLIPSALFLFCRHLRIELKIGTGR